MKPTPMALMLAIKGTKTPLAGHKPVGESGLPQGGPVDRGLPLDSGIPGSKTFVKPEGDVRQPGTDDESIYRVDNADDMTKDRDRIDVREDNADKHDGLGYAAPGPTNNNLTKYPYRDNRPHTKMAQRLVAAWLGR